MNRLFKTKYGIALLVVLGVGVVFASGMVVSNKMAANRDQNVTGKLITAGGNDNVPVEEGGPAKVEAEGENAGQEDMPEEEVQRMKMSPGDVVREAAILLAQPEPDTNGAKKYFTLESLERRIGSSVGVDKFFRNLVNEPNFDIDYKNPKITGSTARVLCYYKDGPFTRIKGSFGSETYYSLNKYYAVLSDSGGGWCITDIEQLESEEIVE